MPVLSARHTQQNYAAKHQTETRYLLVTGRVQGVGFRPFVCILANQMGLQGWIRNISGQVQIGLAGKLERIKAFQSRLKTEAPEHARINSLMETDPVPSAPRPCEVKGFLVLDCNDDVGDMLRDFPTDLPPDRRLCESCLRDLFDPSNRRYLHPFVNCVDCGPRLSVIRSLPYTRNHTSWSQFSMCSECSDEYQNGTPGTRNRRFHSEGNNCPQCGPEYQWKSHTYLNDRASHVLADESCDTADQTPGSQEPKENPETSNPIAPAAAHINAGKIISVKGISGFHLICDASNPDAITELRKRKKRPAKPFAVMCLNPASLGFLSDLLQAPEQALSETAASIVLLPIPKRVKLEPPISLDHLAPRLSQLGVMTAYAPIHYLLFYHLLGKPKGTQWINQACDHFLVVTSANESGEPLISDSRQQHTALLALSDGVLDHNLALLNAGDDSVVSFAGGRHTIRSGRGVAPLSIALSGKGSQVLATGALLKNAFCFTKGQFAHLSRHIGGLSNPATCMDLRKTISRQMMLQHWTPEAIACDLHPDFFSTTLAETLSLEHGVPLYRIQHHRAHIAATMAEFQLDSAAIGLALDGTGYGDDGTQWGGELFVGEGRALGRIGNFSPLQLPGGDRAVRQIWRLAAAAISCEPYECEVKGFATRIQQQLGPSQEFEALLELCSTGNNTLFPSSSSAGRWFDLIASILGLRQICSYEGQAAMELEALATEYGTRLPKPNHFIQITREGELNMYPVLPLLYGIKDTREAAACFHSELIDALYRWIVVAVEKHGITEIVLSGGCFQNGLLRQGLVHALEQSKLRVYISNKVPCNDGGLSLGQAWIAQRLMAGEKR